jgi:cell division protease FtsH
MVTEFGMSDKLGPLRYSENEEEIFLGHSVTQRKNVSDATAKLIDEEIRKLIDEAESKAREVLTTHIDDLHKLAKALLEYETLTGEEVRALLRGEPIHRENPSDTAPDEPSVPTSVPTAGKPKDGPRKRPGGMAPEPQPGT